VEAFRVWLEERRQEVLPRSALGKAVTYCLTQWPKLTRFLEDGHLELDNNAAERAMRPFVIASVGGSLHPGVLLDGG
jgi:transposase